MKHKSFGDVVVFDSVFLLSAHLLEDQQQKDKIKMTLQRE